MAIAQLVCFLVILALSSVTHSRPASTDSNSCTVDHLAKYNLTLTTFWSRDDFPKQYPLYRPNAQWSRLIGRSHGSEYNMWRMGGVASRSVKEFVERGTSTLLDEEVQGEQDILDIFSTRNIPVGVGEESSCLLVDLHRSKVSALIKIIPSPDWFIGLDSIELCNGDEWKDEVTLDLVPMDAGTDKGFTFTSPNWQEVPGKPITEITSKEPSHPANSFFYPELKSLPKLASVSIRRIELSSPEVVYRSVHEKDTSLISQVKMEKRIQEDDDNAESNTDLKKKNLQETAIIWKGEKHLVADDPAQMNTETTTQTTRHETVTSRKRQPKQQRKTNNKKRTDKVRKHRKHPKNKKPKNDRRKKTPKTHSSGRIVDCRISEWSDWTPCSVSCGYGEQSRTRDVITSPKHGGQPCLPLKEVLVCGSMRTCNWKHFNFNWD